jgi:hypothetical protein
VVPLVLLLFWTRQRVPAGGHRIAGPGRRSRVNQPKDFAYSVTQEVDVNGPGLALTLSEHGDRNGSLGLKGRGTFSAGTLLLDGLARISHQENGIGLPCVS